MNMDDLLNALGQASGSQSTSGGQPDLGSLLGALGGGQQGGGQPDLGGLLGGLLGGGGSSGDPLAGLLGGLLGGGQGGAGFTAGGSSPLDALIQPLAQKLGIAPEIAGIVVTFLLNALISGKMTGRSGAATAAPQGGMDLGDAIAGFGSGKASRSGAANSQLVQELSQETGLDEKTAAASIDEFVNLLGGPEGLERVLGAR